VLFVFCLLLFAIFYILSFCFLSSFLFYVAQDKLTNFGRNKKHEARNTIVNKTVVKRNKATGKKQEIGKSML